MVVLTKDGLEYLLGDVNEFAGACDCCTLFHAYDVTAYKAPELSEKSPVSKITPVLMAIALAGFLFLAFDIGRTEGRAAGRASEASHRMDPSAYPKGSCERQIVECTGRTGYSRITMQDPPEFECIAIVPR
jgi:hypothetical protein